MKQLCWIYLLLVLSLAGGCEKENIMKEESYPANYLPLSVGNYWVYDTYRIDEAGIERLVRYSDTIFVTKDTLLRGHHFYMLEGKNFFGENEIQLFRDSTGCILDGVGRPILSPDNFTDTLFHYRRIVFDNGEQDTLYTLSYKMEEPVMKNFSIGAYEAVNCKGTLFVNERYKHPDRPDPIYIDTYYVDGIGKVSEMQMMLGSFIYYERRLSAYHINPY